MIFNTHTVYENVKPISQSRMKIKPLGPYAMVEIISESVLLNKYRGFEPEVSLTNGLLAYSVQPLCLLCFFRLGLELLIRTSNSRVKSEPRSIVFLLLFPNVFNFLNNFGTIEYCKMVLRFNTTVFRSYLKLIHTTSY